MQATSMKLYLHGAVVAVALTMMVIVPIIALHDQRPSHFGWHMYAVNQSQTVVEVTLANGAESSLPLSEVASRVRPESDYAEPTARFLCGHEPAVERVRVTREYPRLDEVYLCESF